jgi:hypothetical protein
MIGLRASSCVSTSNIRSTKPGRGKTNHRTRMYCDGYIWGQPRDLVRQKSRTSADTRLCRNLLKRTPAMTRPPDVQSFHARSWDKLHIVRCGFRSPTRDKRTPAVQKYARSCVLEHLQYALEIGIICLGVPDSPALADGDHEEIWSNSGVC